MSRDGSIDWCTFHGFEARPVFARLLDWGKGGFFRIAPRDEYTATRRYLPGTNVLETRFETAGGTLTLTDCMVVRTGEGHPDHRLIRVVRCLDGEVAVKAKFEPRFDYGLVEPRVELLGSDLAIAYGGPDALVLQSDLPIGTPEVSACAAAHTLRAGEEAYVVLTWALPHELEPTRLPREQITGELAETERFWREWSDRCNYEGPYREQVVRSALVLKALTNAPTGAIVAAATTSLPEEVGGERNWDYRFSWLRDSALTLNALFALGYVDEAHAYVDWLKRTTAGRAKALQIMYGVGGERFLPEVELDHLEGYRGSKPVRIGNGAAAQFQLDVFGELLDTVWLYRTHGGAYALHGFPEEWRRHHQGGLTGYRGREVFAVPGESTPLPDACAVAWNPSVTGGGKSEDTALLTGGKPEVITRTPELGELDIAAGIPRPAILEL